MTKKDIKADYINKLYKRFDRTFNPYENTASWALNEFIADYVIEILKKSEQEDGLENITVKAYECGLCGKQFKEKVAHQCNHGFRKRSIIWSKVF